MPTTIHPFAPPGERIYAIGDIHGRRDLLDRMVQRIYAENENPTQPPTVVFLGDYVDRGDDARGVIDRLSNTVWPWKAHFLLGNHDHVFLGFLGDIKQYPLWRELGGDITMTSYGVRPPRSPDRSDVRRTQAQLMRAVPAGHRRFLERLVSHVEIGDYYFVHAGVRPGTSLSRQKIRDQLWIREEFLASTQIFEKMIVHGHTPVQRPLLLSNRIAVDTGAYATGRLTAAVLEGDACRFVEA